MSEKLAIPSGPAFALERAGHAPPVAMSPSAGATTTTHGGDRISISTLARAVGFAQHPARLEQLAAAVSSGRYLVAPLRLSQVLVRSHLS